MASTCSRLRAMSRAFRAAGDWKVVARVDHPQGTTANELALADLENGADGLQIVFAGSIGACGFVALAATACKAPALSLPAFTFLAPDRTSLALNPLALLRAAEISAAMSTPSLAWPAAACADASVF